MKADIVGMLRVPASVAVTNQAVVPDLILVWTGSTFENRDSGDAQRKFHRCRFEDTLRANQQDPALLSDETLRKDSAG